MIEKRVVNARQAQQQREGHDQKKTDLPNSRVAR